MVNNLDISVIDIHNEFFVKERYPLDYFPFSSLGQRFLVSIDILQTFTRYRILIFKFLNF